MEAFLTNVVNGALVGLLYALVAMGFVVIFRAARVFNFAQGELIVIGAFLLWWLHLSVGLPLWPSVALALGISAVLGLLVERAFFRPLVGQPLFSLVMVTIGLLMLIRGMVLLLWGPRFRPFPVVFGIDPVVVGPLVLDRGLATGGVVTLVVGLGLWWFFNRTRLGLQLTAVAEDHQVALSLGIRVRRSVALAWGLSGVLSTLAAMAFLNGKVLTFLASDVGFSALPVALLAGVESIEGLLLAGVLVGVAQGLASGYLDPLVGGGVGSVFPFVVMVVILLIRPTGLFGWRTIERV